MAEWMIRLYLSQICGRAKINILRTAGTGEKGTVQVQLPEDEDPCPCYPPLHPPLLLQDHPDQEPHPACRLGRL